MKLSEILGWKEKNWGSQQIGWPEGFNEALTSCDREVDREALANVLFNRQPYLRYSREEMKEWADSIISTMPTWLKRSEK